MGAIRLGVNEDLTLKLREAFGIETFIETGTYKGGTALWASRHFHRVTTIEAYRPRYDRFTATALPPNVEAIFGDSRLKLADVLAPLQVPALLWLDAHWCGEGAHNANGDECPLREELAAILAHEAAASVQHVIMIDDARLFTAPPPYPHDPAQWMTVRDIMAMVPARGWSIFEDVIYILPSALIVEGIGGLR